MSLQSVFDHLGEVLKKIGAEEADILGLKERCDRIPDPAASQADLEALAARVAALEAAPGAQPVDLSGLATKTDLDGLAARVDALEVVVPGSQPPPVDLSGLAKTADLDALGARVGAIETGLEGLDIVSGSGAPGVITILPTTLPQMISGADYAATLSAGGGAAPYQFSIASGAFPAGLSMAAGGAITGTPTRADPANEESWTVVVQAHDANGVGGIASYSGTL